jgi:hypothetical protein
MSSMVLFDRMVERDMDLWRGKKALSPQMSLGDMNGSGGASTMR